MSEICVFLQLIYRPDNGEILGVHIFGLHAADLIHEASNAIALATRIQVMTYSKNSVSMSDHKFMCIQHLITIFHHLISHLQFNMDHSKIEYVLDANN